MVKRQALTWSLFLAVALVASPAAFATPGTVSAKQAEARDVLAQIQDLDGNLERAVDAYNLANQRLDQIERDQRENKLQLRLARSNLRHAQADLSSRLVALYTSRGENSGLDVLLGASSIDDLIARLDTVDRVSDQSTAVLKQVKAYRAAVRLRQQGYRIWTQAIPAEITPKNRLLLGDPARTNSYAHPDVLPQFTHL